MPRGTTNRESASTAENEPEDEMEETDQASLVQSVPRVLDTTSPAALSNAVKIEQAQISAELEANPRDETKPGGRILIDGVLCNAWGHAINNDGTLVNPQDAMRQLI